eukprot:1581162-Pleurochrysis_carterae.AAC.1
MYASTDPFPSTTSPSSARRKAQILRADRQQVKEVAPRNKRFGGRATQTVPMQRDGAAGPASPTLPSQLQNRCRVAASAFVAIKSEQKYGRAKTRKEREND